MNAFMFAYAALLFVVLTPGVLLRLPMKGSKMTVALTHGAIFAVVWHFTHKMVWRASYEGFQAKAMVPGKPATPTVMPTLAPKKAAETGMVSTNSPEIQAAQDRFSRAKSMLDAAQNNLVDAEAGYNGAKNEYNNANNDLRYAQDQADQIAKARVSAGTKTVAKTVAKPFFG